MPIKRVDGRTLSPQARQRSLLHSCGLLSIGTSSLLLTEHHGFTLRVIGIVLGALFIAASIANAIWLIRTRPPASDATPPEADPRDEQGS